MWCVIKTKTGIMGEAQEPAHIEVQGYSEYYDAYEAMKSKFAETVNLLKEELEYCEFNGNGREARIFGELAVVVIAVKEVSREEGGVK